MPQKNGEGSTVYKHNAVFMPIFILTIVKAWQIIKLKNWQLAQFGNNSIGKNYNLVGRS